MSKDKNLLSLLREADLLLSEYPEHRPPQLAKIKALVKEAIAELSKPPGSPATLKEVK